ncbi:MAG TPA: hypothetical protein P5186_15685 [Candidatus Paceibacterota bacterium]|nr:hypothetical protein [Verrucomicrobiota bacterium]HRY49491.1 hypothetical protein [Candidatus Paceibacterota bacterium]HSA03121.1 hypothetical protein [Candidatus Paceibacterota bacterium]
MKRQLLSFLTGAALALGVTSAFADDFYPPTWRGDAGSTFQQWEFLSGAELQLPDLYVNPYGDPYALVADHGWYNEISDRQGVFGQSGLMAFYVPNNVNPFEKDVWVQVTWQNAGEEPIMGLMDNNGTPYPLTEDLGARQDAGNGWYNSLYTGQIPFNPPFEVFAIAGDIYVDQVVIDTLCHSPVPELASPACIPLAALGLFCFGAWCRRHSSELN